MTTAVDMSDFIAAKSDQLNADDLMDAPRTITITKVTAQPDAAEQPVSIHYEGGEGRPWKPCKTMRRILVGVWGKDASKYVGRSLTLYRDPTVAFGGLQVGGIRVSHMSDISEDKTVALLVTRGRKAPFKIKPLVKERGPARDEGLNATLATLKAIAKPGNMDALGAAWKEIGADARKALAAELPALKAACAADDEDFGGPLAETPAEAAAQRIVAEIEKSDDPSAVFSRHKSDIEAMPDDLQIKIEVAASQRKTAIQAEREGAK
jgi:hypothetical protein